MELTGITKQDNWNYSVPVYAITNAGLYKVNDAHLALVRGSKEIMENNQEGFITEDLVAVIIEYLKSVNVGELASRETSTAITNFEQGLMWLEKRAKDRAKRGVQATYKK